MLAAPTLWLGLFADDYYHLAIIRRLLPFSSSLEQFRFASGDPSRTLAMVREGPFPWWTLPEVKLAFWRPLSSVLRVLDLRLLGDHPSLHHLHSLFWYLALLSAAALLLRHTLPGTIGALALLIFAVDDAHFVPVAWLANRNSLVAATPAMFAMVLHLQWRERGRRWALPLSVLCWAAALAGGESALGACAYLLAYEVVGSRERWQRRVFALLPAAALGILYIVFYRHWGYGAWGSGTYLDPTAEPARYLRAALVRIPILIAGALLNAPIELTTGSTLAAWVIGAIGVLAAAVFVVALRKMRGALDQGMRRHLTWLSCGSLLALLPVASTFPSNRLLLVPSLGTAAAIAALLVHRWSGLGKVGAATLAALHLVLAPLAWGLMTWASTHAIRHGEEAARSPVVDAASRAGQRVAVLGVPDPLVAMYPGLMRLVWGLPQPAAWWPLSFAPYDHRLVRTSADSFELEVLDGHFLRSEFEQLFRAANRPFLPGTRVELRGLQVEVVASDARGPLKVAYHFDRPLEDSSLMLLTWSDGQFRRFHPPPVGGAVVLRFQPSMGVHF